MSKISMVAESTFEDSIDEEIAALEEISGGIEEGGSGGGSSAPYVYMSADEYLEITPETDKLYWIINNEGRHGVYKNSGFIEGGECAQII